MGRKLFCELSPLTYKISVKKSIWVRNRKDKKLKVTFAQTFQEESLLHLLYKHNSLIRRKLGNVRSDLQENKAINLALSTPKVNKIVIQPGEIFSFWRLVEVCVNLPT